ncbi:MAG: HAD family phosphatase [Bacteroidales bacterium]|nr:HAD family phosphatase [Bacteroidales bacterium]
MYILIPGIPEPESIKNIVFDFGGVICNIDISITTARFKELGIVNFNSAYSVSEQEGLFRKYERGMFTSAEFRDILRKASDNPITDQQIDDAWNAMIKDIPEERVRLIEKLGKEYRTFILSNSNEIHYYKYLQDFRQRFGYSGFDDLVEKAYFSFQIHRQKPDREIFEHVLDNSRLLPGETLFIDDSVQHIKTARELGFLTHHLKVENGEDITDLFSDIKTS